MGDKESPKALPKGKHRTTIKRRENDDHTWNYRPISLTQISETNH